MWGKGRVWEGERGLGWGGRYREGRELEKDVWGVRAIQEGRDLSMIQG